MSTETMQNAIAPRSDQQNVESYPPGVTRTIRITSVKNKGGTEQPVSVFFDGDEGKPWKPCKSSCRVLVYAWGMDPSKYAGKSLTLFGDPTVTYGGMAVGGIRISHMSDIDDKLTGGVMAVMLTEKRGSRKPFIVRPLKTEAATPAPDKAAEWTAKLIAKIESLPHQGEAHAILASEAVSKKIHQLHESRPELEKAIYTAVNALPVLPDPEQAPLTIAALLTLLDGAETEEDAQGVMIRPEVESLDAESMTKLSERYRATVARVSA